MIHITRPELILNHIRRVIATRLNMVMKRKPGMKEPICLSGLSSSNNQAMIEMIRMTASEVLLVN